MPTVSPGLSLIGVRPFHVFEAPPRDFLGELDVMERL